MRKKVIGNGCTGPTSGRSSPVTLKRKHSDVEFTFADGGAVGFLLIAGQGLRSIESTSKIFIVNCARHTAVDKAAAVS